MTTLGRHSSVSPVLVIGATGGVGFTVARLLADAGFEVVASCRTASQAKQLLQAGVCRHALKMALDKPRTIEAAFERLQQLGVERLAGLVNCAAITYPRPIELSPLSEVRRTFEINLFGALDVIQKSLPLLRLGQGRIVLLSSTSGSISVPLLGAYSASKFALEAIADVIRRELAPWNIGVSLVIPGGIKTQMIDRQLLEIDAALKQLKPGLESGYSDQYRQHRWLIEAAEKSSVTSEQVSELVLRALTDLQPKARYLCGLPSAAARALRRTLSDSMFDRLFSAVPIRKERS